VLLANVQYAHIQTSRLSSADTCLIARGGCAYLLLNANDVGPCTTSGLVLGDSSAFQRVSPPWHQYDVYAARATNNVVANVNGAPCGGPPGQGVPGRCSTQQPPPQPLNRLRSSARLPPPTGPRQPRAHPWDPPHRTARRRRHHGGGRL
jgi:hypothetical protein